MSGCSTRSRRACSIATWLFDVLVSGSRRRGGALPARFAERRALVAGQIGGERAAAKAMVLDALMLGLAAERLAGASDAEIEAALDEFEVLTR